MSDKCHLVDAGPPILILVGACHTVDVRSACVASMYACVAAMSNAQPGSTVYWYKKSGRPKGDSGCDSARINFACTPSLSPTATRDTAVAVHVRLDASSS